MYGITNNYYLNIAGNKMPVLDFSVNHYGIGEHYQGFVEVLSQTRIESLLNKKLCLQWQFAGELQYFHGVLYKINLFGRKDALWQYRLDFASPLYPLLHHENNRVFVNKSLAEIIRSVLADNQFTSLEFKILAKGGWGNIRHSFTAQFHQSDWQFLLRLLHRFGWYCYWQQEKHAAVLVFCNDNQQLPQKVTQLDYIPEAQMVSDKPRIYRLHHKLKNLPKSYFFTDYNYQTPNLNLSISSETQANVPSIGTKAVDGMHYATLEQGKESILHAQQALDVSRELTTVWTDDAALMPGQLLKISQHPSVKLNGIYRVLSLDYQASKTACQVKAQLAPAKYQFRLLYDLYQRSAKNLLLRATVYSDNDEYPDLDDQGRYKIQFYFDPQKTVVPHIRALHAYAGVANAKPVGLHHPLRGGTEVLVGFMNGDIDRPLILGALTSGESPNPVSSANASQQRFRSWGGNELVMEDNRLKPSVDLHTGKEQQRLHLNATRDAELVQLANNLGDMQLYAQDNMFEQVGGDYYLKVGGEQQVKVSKSQYLKTLSGKISLQAAKNISLQAGQDLGVQTVKGDANFSAKNNINFSANNNLDMLAKQGNINLNSQDSIQATVQAATVQAPKIKLGSVNLLATSAALGGMTLSAPHIDQYHPVGAGAMPAGSGRIKSTKQKKSLPKKPDNFQDLIAVSFRNDPRASKQYFSNKVEKADQYFHKEKLSSKELQYFKNHGNNVTIFIHGYNVPYGEFGGKLSSFEKTKLAESILSRVDILRSEQEVLEHLPDARLHHKFLGSLQSRRQRELTPDPIDEDLREMLIKNPEQYLNGDGAHNWWLHMEWNLNMASGQFNGEDFKNYTRLLHVAWHGDPLSPLDYIADIETANYAGEKLVALIKQLRAASSDMKINIVAHSLGNYVLLKAMDLLGESAVNSLNHVFMWEPAVPDVALSSKPPAATPNYYRFLNANKAAKKITVLHSMRDNILGPIINGKTEFWQKKKDQGVAAAFTVWALAKLDAVIEKENRKTRAMQFLDETPTAMQAIGAYVAAASPSAVATQMNLSELRKFGHGIIARPLKSIYLLANLLGKPAGYFSDSKQTFDYYQNFRQQYHYVEYQHGKPLQKSFPVQLRDLERLFINHCPSAFVAMAMTLHTLSHPVEQWSQRKVLSLLHTVFEDYFDPVKMLHQYPVASQAAAVILAVLVSNKPEPRMAMGYQGVDAETKRQLGAKLIEVDQTEYLFSHSGMRIPSPTLMEKIYCDKIFGASNYQLGTYKRSKN